MDLFGGLFGAVGSIIGGAMQADAIKDATDKQIKALEKQRNFVYSELDPNKVGAAATAADIDQARNRLALQAMIDPSLAALRGQSSDAILRQAGELGAGSTASQVGNVAAKEAISGVAGMEDLKNKLVSEAMKEIEMGATLPPDVQNELVKAGLEKSGMVTGAASPKGVGGTILRQLVGTAGLALKAQRQERAAKLGETAQNLESQRQQLLGTLFPNLSTVQLGQLAGQQNALQQSNAMVPQAGLDGQDVTNLWLARVGATNQLAQSAADAAARGGMGVANAWQNAIGSAIGYGSKMFGSDK